MSDTQHENESHNFVNPCSGYIRPGEMLLGGDALTRATELIQSILDAPDPVGDPYNRSELVRCSLDWRDPSGRNRTLPAVGYDLSSWDIVEDDSGSPALEAQRASQDGMISMSFNLALAKTRILYSRRESDGENFHNTVILATSLQSEHPQDVLGSPEFRNYGILHFQERGTSVSSRRSLTAFGVEGERVPYDLARRGAISFAGAVIPHSERQPLTRRPACLLARDAITHMRLFPELAGQLPETATDVPLALDDIATDSQASYLDVLIRGASIEGVTRKDSPRADVESFGLRLEQIFGKNVWEKEDDPELAIDHLATSLVPCLEEPDLVRLHKLSVVMAYGRRTGLPYSLGLIDQSDKRFYGALPINQALKIFAPGATPVPNLLADAIDKLAVFSSPRL